MNLRPATPEQSVLFFIYGITIGFAEFALLEGSNFLDEPLPTLTVFDRWKDTFNRYQFDCRGEEFALFKNVDGEQMPEPDGTLLTEQFRKSLNAKYNKRIPLNQWSEGIALYFDYLAATDLEQHAKQAVSHQPSYHVILDQRDDQGELLTRRLLHSVYSYQAASYTLRQHRLWQAYLWQYYNLRDMYSESAFTKYRTLTPVLNSTVASKLTALIEYPHSRGRKRSYTRHWHWHISRNVPLVESKKPEHQADQDHEDERWTHRPGDPKLLREYGTGLFGSYPSYEGDDEPEYRDEQ